MLRSIRSLTLGVVFAGLSLAASVTYPNGKTTNISGECTNFAGYTCYTSAYFDLHSLDEQNDSQNINALFVSAFDAWNATNAADAQWTLLGGGGLDGTLSVSIATAEQFGPVTSGGLEIQVDLSGATLPTLGTGDTLGWAQGLFDNYLLDGSIVQGFAEMDIKTPCGDGVFCPPLYPFQYVDNRFYDQPKASYKAPGSAQAYFDANAYLAVRNTTTRTLTVYDGVSYGFQNGVSPEPGTWLLLLSGFGLLVLVGRRQVQ